MFLKRERVDERSRNVRMCVKHISPWYIWNTGKDLCNDIARSIIDEYNVYCTTKVARCTVYYYDVNSRYDSLG